ncbi:MAG: preprotein translocase subunit YajC [Ornithinimicrobium sp.]
MPAITTAASGGESGSLSVLILALPLALLAYLIFAQRRRGRRERKAQQELQIGDAVMTRAGMFGTIADLHGPVVRVEVAPGVVVTFDRRAVIPGAAPDATRPDSPTSEVPDGEGPDTTSNPADSPDSDRE